MFPVLNGDGTSTLGLWLAGSGDAATAAAYATAVLLLAYPVGLGCAHTFAIVLGARRLQQLGLEVCDPGVLRAARRVDTIVLRTAGALVTRHAKGSLRPTASRAVAALRDLDVEPVLLTVAESRRVDDPVATAVGIDEVINGVPVGRTDEAVARLQRDGRVVAVMGDHVHDVRALARADLGIADRPSSGALGVAHPSLERTELWTAVDAIRLGRLMDQVVRSNMVLATAVTAAAWPLAAAGRLSPAGLVATMALSAGAVAANSLRLRRFQRRRPPAHRRGER